jgi:hypothetical protein
VWTQDAQGTWFRYASELEVADNEWPTDTWLVWYPPADVRVNEELPVVVDSATLEYAPLVSDMVWSGIDAHVFDFSSTRGPRTVTPTLYRLATDTGSLPPGEPEIAGHVTTDDVGGLYAWVTLPSGASPAREVLANEANAQIENIGLPGGGGVPPPDELLVVSAPDDGSALPPSTEANATVPPGTPVAIAMFGTMLWCQKHPTNWVSLIGESVLEMRSGFRTDQPGPADTDTGWDITLEKTWCMFWDEDDPSEEAVDEARWCEWGLRPPAIGSPCEPYTCIDGGGHEYPFTGCHKLSGCFLDKVWEAVEYADAYIQLPDLMLAQAQIGSGMQTEPGNPYYESPACPADSTHEDTKWNCGIAKFPSAGALAGASAIPGRPYLAWGPDLPGIGGCDSPFSWSHELGHNFNYTTHHQNYVSVPGNGECDYYKTLMNDDDIPPSATCKVNWFHEDVVDHMQSTCVPGVCPRSAPYVDHL